MQPSLVSGEPTRSTSGREKGPPLTYNVANGMDVLVCVLQMLWMCVGLA